MFTIFIEIIMSVFIANFKASEHPYINIVAKGIIFTIIAFILGIFIYIKKGEEFPIIFALTLCISIGIIVTLLMFLVEITVDFFDKKNK